MNSLKDLTNDNIDLFLLPIEDVFSISGRGTVVTGRVERGVIHVGDEIEIVGLKETQKTTCTGVEMFRKLLDEGQAGDNVGVLLRGTKREDVERGQVLAKPGTITPHTKFKAEVYVLSKEEGGRHTPFFANYRPQFYFRTTDVTGAVTLEWNWPKRMNSTFCARWKACSGSLSVEKVSGGMLSSGSHQIHLPRSTLLEMLRSGAASKGSNTASGSYTDSNVPVHSHPARVAPTRRERLVALLRRPRCAVPDRHILCGACVGAASSSLNRHGQRRHRQLPEASRRLPSLHELHHHPHGSRDLGARTPDHGTAL